MSEGLSLHGRRERLEKITTLGIDEIYGHQAVLSEQLAVAEKQGIIRWRGAILQMLAAIAFELDMREIEALTSEVPASGLVSV